ACCLSTVVPTRTSVPHQDQGGRVCSLLQCRNAQDRYSFCLPPESGRNVARAEIRGLPRQRLDHRGLNERCGATVADQTVDSGLQLGEGLGGRDDAGNVRLTYGGIDSFHW